MKELNSNCASFDLFNPLYFTGFYFICILLITTFSMNLLFSSVVEKKYVIRRDNGYKHILLKA